LDEAERTVAPVKLDILFWGDDKSICMLKCQEKCNSNLHNHSEKTPVNKMKIVHQKWRRNWGELMLIFFLYLTEKGHKSFSYSS
jgi:hypothetical protein